MERVSLKAPAKINLYLHVIGKRADGFHEIESLMQTIDLCDEIRLERSDVIELFCNDPSLPSGDGNLAYRAASLLQSRIYFPGVRIELSKLIPSGAGLGGGSSDAAFVLRGLCQLYGLRPSPKELLEIAGTLGSDVPFFLTHGQALVKGRGEIIQRVQLPLDYRIVVASPPISISTAEVYNALKIDLTKRKSDLLLKKKINLTRLLQLMPKFGNDLEEVVFMKFPGLSDLKQSLLGAGASYSSMTGSGSSFFGLFGSGVVIEDILEYLKGRDVKVFVCRPILMPPFRQ